MALSETNKVQYKDKANVRVEFYSTAEGAKINNEKGASDFGLAGQSDKIYHNLYGFLTDEGLKLRLDNEFAPSLDLAGGLLGQLGELIGSSAAAIRGLAGNQTTGYITTGFGGEKSIMLNAPQMWKGTKPINFDISLFQVADYENEILKNYQRILEILSPLTGGGIETANLSTTGPGLVKVHYFPVDQNGKMSLDAQGKIIFGPCLCNSVTMEIKPPYSASYMPIIGVYSFSLVTSRILDRSGISKLFDNKLLPWPGDDKAKTFDFTKWQQDY